MHAQRHTLHWFCAVILNIIIRSAYGFRTPVVEQQTIPAGLSALSTSVSPPSFHTSIIELITYPPPQTEPPKYNNHQEQPLSANGRKYKPQEPLAPNGPINYQEQPLAANGPTFSPQEPLAANGPTHDNHQEQPLAANVHTHDNHKKQLLVANNLTYGSLQEQPLAANVHTHDNHKEQLLAANGPTHDNHQERPLAANVHTHDNHKEQLLAANSLTYGSLQEQPLAANVHTHDNHKEQLLAANSLTYDNLQDRPLAANDHTHDNHKEQLLSANSLTYDSLQDRPLAANDHTHDNHKEQLIAANSLTYDSLQEQPLAPNGHTHDNHKEQPLAANGHTHDNHKLQPLAATGPIFSPQEPLAANSLTYDSLREQPAAVNSITYDKPHEQPIAVDGLAYDNPQDQSLAAADPTYRSPKKQSLAANDPTSSTSIPLDESLATNSLADGSLRKQPLTTYDSTQSTQPAGSGAEVMSNRISQFQRSVMTTNGISKESIIGTFTPDAVIIKPDSASKQVNITYRQEPVQLEFTPASSNIGSNRTTGTGVNISPQPTQSTTARLAQPLAPNTTLSQILRQYSQDSILQSPASSNRLMREDVHGKIPSNFNSAKSDMALITSAPPAMLMATRQDVSRDPAPLETPSNSDVRVSNIPNQRAALPSEAFNAHVHSLAVHGVSPTMSSGDISAILDHIPQQYTMQTEDLMTPVDVQPSVVSPQTPASIYNVRMMDTLKLGPKAAMQRAVVDAPITKPSLRIIPKEMPRLHNHTHEKHAEYTSNLVSRDIIQTQTPSVPSNIDNIVHTYSVNTMTPQTANPTGIPGPRRHTILKSKLLSKGLQQSAMLNRGQMMGRPTGNSLSQNRVFTPSSDSKRSQTQMRYQNPTKAGITRKASIKKNHGKRGPGLIYPPHLSSIPDALLSKMLSRSLLKFPNRRLSKYSIYNMPTNEKHAVDLLRNIYGISKPKNNQIIRGLYNYADTDRQKLPASLNTERTSRPGSQHLKIPKGRTAMNYRTRSIPSSNPRIVSSIGLTSRDPNHIADVLRKLILLSKAKKNRILRGISTLKNGHEIPAFGNRGIIRKPPISRQDKHVSQDRHTFAARVLEERAKLLSRLGISLDSRVFPASRHMVPTETSRTAKGHASEILSSKQFVENRPQTNYIGILPPQDAMSQFGEKRSNFRLLPNVRGQSASTVPEIDHHQHHHHHHHHQSDGPNQHTSGISQQSPETTNGGNSLPVCSCALRNIAKGPNQPQTGVTLPGTQNEIKGKADSPTTILSVSGSVDISPSYTGADTPAVVTLPVLSTLTSSGTKADSRRMIPNTLVSLTELTKGTLPEVDPTNAGIPNQLGTVEGTALKRTLFPHTSDIFPPIEHGSNIRTSITSNNYPNQIYSPYGQSLEINANSNLNVIQPTRKGSSQQDVNGFISATPSEPTVGVLQPLANGRPEQVPGVPQQPAQVDINIDSRPSASQAQAFGSTLTNLRQLRVIPSSNATRFYKTSKGRLIRVNSPYQIKSKKAIRNRSKLLKATRTEPVRQEIENIPFPKQPARSPQTNEIDNTRYRRRQRARFEGQPHRNQVLNPYAMQLPDLRRGQQLPYTRFPQQSRVFPVYASRYRPWSYPQESLYPQRSFTQTEGYTQAGTHAQPTAYTAQGSYPQEQGSYPQEQGSYPQEQGSYPRTRSTSRQLYVLRFPGQRGRTIMAHPDQAQMSARRSAAFRPGFGGRAAPQDRTIPRTVPRAGAAAPRRRDSQSEYDTMTSQPQFPGTQQRTLYQVTGVNPMIPK